MAGGLLVPLLPLLAAWLAGGDGWVGWWFAGPIVVFGVIPLLDTAFGRDASNPPDWAVPSLEADRYYRWCT